MTLAGNCRSLVRGDPNQNGRSERAQQHGADERKHGEHGQHVEPQGKVHVTLPVLLDTTKV